MSMSGSPTRVTSLPRPEGRVSSSAAFNSPISVWRPIEDVASQAGIAYTALVTKQSPNGMQQAAAPNGRCLGVGYWAVVVSDRAVGLRGCIAHVGTLRMLPPSMTPRQKCGTTSESAVRTLAGVLHPKPSGSRVSCSSVPQLGHPLSKPCYGPLVRIPIGRELR